MKSLSCVWLLATPWTAAYQAPPSMGFSRQEDWSGVPLPSPTVVLNTFQTFQFYHESSPWYCKEDNHNSCSQKKPPLKDWMIVSCFYRAEESCEPKLEFEPNLSDSKKPVLNHSITHRRKEGQNVPFKQWEGQLDWRLKYLNIRKKRHTGKKKMEKNLRKPQMLA